MTSNIRLLLALATSLALALGCGAAATPSPSPSPQAQAPTATPVSPEVRQSARQFAGDYQSIAQDWDEFHRDFDQWRTGLTSCQRSSAEAAFREFAADFNNEVLGRARNLPRTPSVRSLADQLIEAAEGEAEALRQLRDGWQPADNSFFSAVETQRSAASAAQQEVLDKLNDLEESANPGAVEEAQEFSDAFEQVSSDWESFHDSYSSLRDRQADLAAEEMSNELDSLLDQFDPIVSAVGDLPSSETTQDMAEQLEQAADAEANALTDLRDDFQARADASESPKSSNGGSNGEQTSAESGNPFAEMNGMVLESDQAREQVQNDLKAILEDTGAQKATDIAGFRREYDALVREWNQFHRDYDEWIRTEGGCNRSEVIDRLGQFSVRFGEISTRVRNLPSSSVARPMKDTLVEAAQREEEALRVLRDTWRPFVPGAYRALEQQRANVGMLRRQAEVSIQEMLERFGIPPSEV